MSVLKVGGVSLPLAVPDEWDETRSPGIFDNETRLESRPKKLLHMVTVSKWIAGAFSSMSRDPSYSMCA